MRAHENRFLFLYCTFKLILIFGCTSLVLFIVSTSQALAQGPRVIDSTCRGEPTEVLPVVLYPRPGEPLEERPEITLQLLSLIPCSVASRDGEASIRAELGKSLKEGKTIQEAVDGLKERFRAEKPKARRVFGIVSEFFDNLSITLFELDPAREPVFLKLTVKRDDWSRPLEELRPHFANAEEQLLASLDRASQLRTVRIAFPVESDKNDTLTRLRSELSASVRSRFRNPLSPNLWERRTFFRLADDKETPDATLTFRIESNATRIFANAVGKDNAGNARSLWLEGSIASLPAFERALFEASRDMLMDLAHIYDYSATLGPEFMFSRGTTPSALAALTIRHNRGDLAASFLFRYGRLDWEGTCGKNGTLFDMGLLPGWQFVQTERFSADAGVHLGAGLVDAAFRTPSQKSCDTAEKPIFESYVSATYALYSQFNYTSSNRFSFLARVTGGGLALIPARDNSAVHSRSRLQLNAHFGVGVAL